MSPEAIARRFESIAGHDLIDYAEVGLPIFRLLVDSVTMVRRPLNPIAEFVLRGAKAGLVSSVELSSFLGLDLDVINPVISVLTSDGLVRVSQSDTDGEILELTETGLSVLAEAAQYKPQDQILSVDYDGLLCRPIAIQDEALSRSSDLLLRNAVEIHPYPADPPKADDLDISDVALMIAKQPRGKDERPYDLLALKRVTRVIRLFRPAVGLVYRMRATKDVRVVFVVDSSRKEDLERAFAEKQGPRKMRIIKSVEETDVMAKIKRRLGREVTEKLPKPELVNELRRAASLAEIKVDAQKRKLERADNPDDQLAANRALQDAVAELQKATSALQQLPARAMAVYEQSELLSRALREATRAVYIGSRTVSDAILSSRIIDQFVQCLNRGVRLTITLTSREAERGSRQALLRLNDLAKRYDNLSFEFSDSSDGIFYLLADDQFAVLTNRPFLSNLGKTKTFMHVQGIVIEAAELVRPISARFAT